MRAVVKWLRSGWGWFSTIVTILGLPSLVSDLEAWRRLSDELASWFRAIRLPEAILEFIKAIYSVYDAVVDAVFSWIPEMFRHGAAIVVVVIGPTLIATAWNLMVELIQTQKRNASAASLGRVLRIDPGLTDYLVSNFFFEGRVPRTLQEFQQFIDDSAAGKLTLPAFTGLTAERWRSQLALLAPKRYDVLHLHAIISKPPSDFKVEIHGAELSGVPLAFPVVRFYFLTFFISIFSAVEFFVYAGNVGEPLVWSTILCVIFWSFVPFRQNDLTSVDGIVACGFIISVVTFLYAFVNLSAGVLIVFVLESLALMCVCFGPLHRNKYRLQGG